MISLITKYYINKMNKEKLEKFMFSNFNKMPLILKEVSLLRYTYLILEEKGIKNYSVDIKRFNDHKQAGHCYPQNKTNEYSEKIILNKTYILYANLFEILSTIQHECKHAIQNNVLKEESNEYTKKLDYAKNKTNINIYFCNFILKDVSLHIKIDSFLSTISNIFYHLNISEREAFLEEDKFYSICKNKYDFIEDKEESRVQRYVGSFNERYKCNLNKEEVFRIIDQCYENLVENKLPPHNEEGNLIATIMYDMCLVSGYNSDILSKEETMQLSTLKEKQKQLAKYDYFVYGVKYDGNLFSLEEQKQIIENPILLKDLTKAEQNLNYIMIWKAISNNKDKPLEYFNELLKDKDTFFKQIVENDLSREMCSEYLANLFGEEFTKYASKDSNIKE